MLKRIVLIIVVMLVSIGWAHAQLLEAAAYYVVNKALAAGEKRETTSGKLLFNVYYEEQDGSLTQLPGWDPSTATSVAWTDNIVLEPVVSISRTHGDPREIQFYLDNSDGPKTIAYVAVHGGRRGPKGRALDNVGFERKAPLIHVHDIPKGWNAVGARWGNGACSAQFERLDVRDMYSLFEREDIRGALAGAGQSTYPTASVVTAVIDGQVKTFMSPSEADNYVKGLQEEGQQKANVLDTKKQDPPPADLLKEGLEFRAIYYDRTEVMRQSDPTRFLTDCLAKQSPIEIEKEVLLRSDLSTALLIASSSPFQIWLEDGRGQKIADFPVGSAQGAYGCLVTLRPFTGSGVNKLVIRTDTVQHEYAFRSSIN